MKDYPKIKRIEPLADRQLLATFDNGVQKVYNCQPLLNEEPFDQLQDDSLFRQVKADAGGYGICWNDELDLSESELWINGLEVGVEANVVHEM